MIINPFSKNPFSIKIPSKKTKNQHNPSNLLSLTIIVLIIMKELVNKNANVFAYNFFLKSPKSTQDSRANLNLKMSLKSSTNSSIISSNVSNGPVLPYLKEYLCSKVFQGSTSKKEKLCFSKRGNIFSISQRLLILLILPPITNKFISLKMSSRYCNY
jgi:hypothetical protein